MHNLNDCAKIYIEAFKDAGYETYDFILPYYLYCARLLDKIDHQFFTSGFVTDSVTSNRLIISQKRRKREPLTNGIMKTSLNSLTLSLSAGEISWIVQI